MVHVRVSDASWTFQNDSSNSGLMRRTIGTQAAWDYMYCTHMLCMPPASVAKAFLDTPLAEAQHINSSDFTERECRKELTLRLPALHLLVLFLAESSSQPP